MTPATVPPLPAPIGLPELMRGFFRLVVVAPHPDDETLGVGGVLASALRQSIPIAVISVTDGEASHSHSDWWTADSLSSARATESTRALRLLGWEQPVLHRLQLPDGAVDREPDLTRHLEKLLAPYDLVLTTWRHDGHPDNEATARAVETVAKRIGCGWGQFPLWARTRLLRERSDLLTAHSVRRFNLDPDALQCKETALQAYRSQLDPDPISQAAPTLAASTLKEFLVDYEILILPDP